MFKLMRGSKNNILPFFKSLWKLGIAGEGRVDNVLTLAVNVIIMDFKAHRITGYMDDRLLTKFLARAVQAHRTWS